MTDHDEAGSGAGRDDECAGGGDKPVAAALATPRFCDDGGRHARSGQRDQHGASIASTIVRVNLDSVSPAALHERVAGALRRAIADGEARPGERLPPARDLAAVLGVNTNTVLRALRTLRDEGLLEFRRGRGVTVVATPERTELVAKARELVELAAHGGYTRGELVALIEGLA